MQNSKQFQCLTSRAFPLTLCLVHQSKSERRKFIMKLLDDGNLSQVSKGCQPPLQVAPSRDQSKNAFLSFSKNIYPRFHERM